MCMGEDLWILLGRIQEQLPSCRTPEWISLSFRCSWSQCSAPLTKKFLWVWGKEIESATERHQWIEERRRTGFQQKKRCQGLSQSHAILFNRELMRESRSHSRCKSASQASSATRLGAMTTSLAETAGPCLPSAPPAIPARSPLRPAHPLELHWHTGQVTSCQNQQGIACHLNDSNILISSING